MGWCLVDFPENQRFAGHITIGVDLEGKIVEHPSNNALLISAALRTKPYIHANSIVGVRPSNRCCLTLAVRAKGKVMLQEGAGLRRVSVMGRIRKLQMRTTSLVPCAIGDRIVKEKAGIDTGRTLFSGSTRTLRRRVGRACYAAARRGRSSAGLRER